MANTVFENKIGKSKVLYGLLAMSYLYWGSQC